MLRLPALCIGVFLLLVSLACAQQQSAPRIDRRFDIPTGSRTLYAEVGGRISLGVAFDSATPVTIRWLRNGHVISQADNITARVAPFDIVPASLSDAGTYWAEISNSAGTAQSPWSVVVVLPVNPPTSDPIYPKGPIEQSAGTSFSLTSRATGPVDYPSGFPRFQWSRDGAPIVGATDVSYFVPYATRQDSGDYTVARDEGRGANTSTAVHVTITGEPAPALPFVHILPREQPVLMPRQPLTIAVGIVSATPITYQWYHNGTLLPQFIGPELSIASMLIANTGTYVLIARNAHGAIHALAHSVQVRAGSVAPIQIEPLPAKVELFPGLPITIIPRLESDISPSVQWYRNGQPITSNNAPNIRLTHGANVALINGAGTYHFVARNQFGSSTSASMTVTLAPADAGGIYAGTRDLLFPRRGEANNGLVAYIDANNVAQIISLGSWSVVTGSGAWITGPFVMNDVQLQAGEAAFTPTRLAESIASGKQLTFSAGAGSASLRPSGDAAVTSISRSVAGPMQARSGYYRGSVLGVASSEVHAILTPEGIVGAIVIADGLVFSAYSRIDENPSAVRPLFLGIESSTAELSGFLEVRGVGRGFTASRVKGSLRTRLVNVASRGYVGGADRTMIVGFTLAGAGQKPLLLRGIGPTLGSFGVGSAVPDTTLSIFQDSRRLVQNDDWGSSTDAPAIAAAAVAAGAFALASGSRDAAVLPSLSSGSYTAQVADRENREGIALVELYDASSAEQSGPSISNLSIRGYAASGENALIAGLAINGAVPQRLLIRAVGPGLDAFQVAGALRDPRLQVFRGDALVADNDDWGGAAELATAARTIGAFALVNSSRDSALIVTLPPGSYTVQVAGKNGEAGVALVETYVLP
ncbi:MAG: hypothetical protein V4773_24390 [Verrucomicrobiota bacterium]